MTAGDIVTAVLLPVGGVFSLLGALGVLRFPSLHTRLHASTKPQTLGLLLILAGVAPQAGSLSGATPLLLVGFFQLLTAPVTAQTIGGAAYRAGLIDRDELVVDETQGEDTRRGGAQEGGRGSEDHSP